MRNRIALTACVVLSLVHSARAALELPSIFSDRMVLQQGREVPVWGRALPGEQVRVTLEGVDGATARARADASGRWMVRLPALAASSTPRNLRIRTMPVSRNLEPEERVVTDVLVGEVWLCSGQSNMQWTLDRCGQSDIDLSAADHAQIRMFNAAMTSVPEPQDDVEGAWVVCDRSTAPGFSAVAYYFGRSLQRSLDVPIGLIHASWGGSTAEAWTTRSTLESMPETGPILERFARMSVPDPDTEDFTSILHDDAEWETVVLPSTFADQGHDIDGVIWYRLHFDLPRAWDGRELEVTLGPIDDADVVWLNGFKIGETMNAGADRRYLVPPVLARPGPSLLTVRVSDFGGIGGFTGPVPKLRMGPVDAPGDRRMLTGPWLMQVSERPFVRPMSANHRPAHLYNGMINPLVPFGIRGAIWYQGESNVDRADQYSTLFPAMIEDWRAAWGQDAFPFYYVQIAPYDYGRPLECAELREAQGDALRLPATGMVITMDVGDPRDIHPVAKEPVGERLALLARADVYGQDVVARAPVLRGTEVEGAALILRFEGVCLPLETLDGAVPTHFELAGADRIFHPATASVDGESIRLTCDAVSEPVAARYAWSDDAEPNLAGACGLPVGPFRTDEWPRSTAGRR